MSCAVHTTLGAGVSSTTLELKVYRSHCRPATGTASRGCHPPTGANPESMYWDRTHRVHDAGQVAAADMEVLRLARLLAHRDLVDGVAPGGPLVVVVDP